MEQMERPERDFVTIQDEQGQQKEYAIEALFDMDDNAYALLAADDETVLMRLVEGGDEQYLEGIVDPEEANSILNAYQIAVEEAPAE